MRKSYRKKYYRKRFKKSGRRNVRAYLKRKQKIGLSLFKIRDTIAITSDAAGQIEYRMNLTNPTDTFFSGATAGDWSNLVGLYDQYRVFAVKVKYIPTLPFDSSTVTGYYPLYGITDFDDTAALTSVAQTIEYENMKVKNMYKPWKLYQRVPKVTNLASNSTIVSPGWMDIANPQSTGAIKVYGTGFDGNTRYGTWIGTWYLGCKNRR